MGSFFSIFWYKLFGPSEKRILMVGLDNAGKTTILYQLKLNEVVDAIPTIGFNVEKVQYKNIMFTVQDIGGQEKIRPIQRQYAEGTHGVIFVVDSADTKRLSYSKEAPVSAQEELHKMFNEQSLRNSALLVLANKQDLDDALTSEEVTQRLELSKLSNHNQYVQPTCALEGNGLKEGLRQLADTLRKNDVTGHASSLNRGTSGNSSAQINKSISPSSQWSQAFGTSRTSIGNNF